MSRILVILQQEEISTWSEETAGLLAITVDQIFAGLVYDNDLLRAVLLALLDSHISEEGDESHKPVPEAILTLQACLNRLILFA